ncbi:MAG: hypothetical protein INR69_11120 [Mucilaginibacter polytrichastri]|nr:hypothetical protein [Mucilaginibacter polytrichastri]
MAQTYKDSINQQFARYNSLITNKEFDKALDYANPGMFKIVDRQQLVVYMKSIFNNPSFEYTTFPPDINSVSNDTLINGAHHSTIRYTATVNFHFIPDSTTKKNAGLYQAAFAKEFGEQNIHYNEKTNIFSITTEKKAVAFSSDQRKWLFSVIEKKQIELLKKFIPSELVTVD